jgi:hypothetical protein
MARHAASSLVLGLLLAGAAAAADPASEQLFFTGASAPGQNTLSVANGVYSFRFTGGDEDLTWQIDLSDPKVAGGMLRIRELSSDCYAIDGGGPAFRDAAGAITYPSTNYKTTTLTGQSTSGGVLTLDYKLTLNGSHPFRYQISAQGKQLTVRATDPSGSVAGANNFAGLAYMKSTGVENPVPIFMQGALADPITMFRHDTPQGTEHFFVANMLDMFRSNGSDYRIGPLITPNIGPDSTTFSIDTATKYETMTNGKIAAPLDDTFLIVVSSRIRDVLLDTTAPPSPYRSLLANRMVFDGTASVWTNYDTMFDACLSYGMFNLAGYFFFDWTASAPDPPEQESVGPDWAPAFDQAHFTAMLKHGTAFGHMLGGYTAFNCMPATAPPAVYDATQIVQDGNGNWKTYTGIGYPLIGVEASGLHAAEESALMAALGMNLAYVDIQTFGSVSKGPDGSHLDQKAGSPWAKTMRQGYIAQKIWFDGMRDTLGGPLLGEGSIGTQNGNMEFFNYGYVDSTQRVINTGGSGQSVLQPAGSPYAPTNWQIIPEYEWRVAARRQVNHGNGFYDRFFGPSDGPTVVNSGGWPIYPLTQDATDLYQAYLLTYGHSGYVITNGTDTLLDFLTYPQLAEAYFLTNALQSLWFASPIAKIRYLHDGAWKSFESIVFQTETLDTFRHIPIRLDFQSGLRIVVNHGQTPLALTEGGVAYTLPARTGWWAGMGGWLLAFSAIPPGTGGQRIDYCKAAAQYEYFNGRGAVSGYGGIVAPAQRSAWTITPTNVTVAEDASGKLTASSGAAPDFLGVVILPGELQLAAGARTGLKALGVFANGGVLDFTTLLTWYSQKPGVATVTSAGIVTAVGSGTTKIVAVGLGGAIVSAPVSVTVN